MLSYPSKRLQFKSRSLKKFGDLVVRLVPRFRKADGDEDGADGAEAGVQPEGAVEAHLKHHRAVRCRQDKVDLQRTNICI